MVNERLGSKGTVCRAGSEILSLGKAVGIGARFGAEICRYDIWCRMWLKDMPGRLVGFGQSSLGGVCTSIRESEGLLEAPDVEEAAGELR